MICHIFEVSRARGVFWVEARGRKVTVEAAQGRCSCAPGRRHRRCDHLDAVERYCRRHGLTFGPTAVCPVCDAAPGAVTTCAVCAGRGRLLESEARALRQSRWPLRSAAENQRLLRQWGEKNERDVPKSRQPWSGPDEPLEAAA